MGIHDRDWYKENGKERRRKELAARKRAQDRARVLLYAGVVVLVALLWYFGR